MPFPNEHSARLRRPGLFIRFRRSNDELGDGIDAIFGIRRRDGQEVVELQAIRFDKNKFTVDQAKAWLSDHDFRPILFEEATEPEGQSGHTDEPENKGVEESVKESISLQADGFFLPDALGD